MKSNEGFKFVKCYGPIPVLAERTKRNFLKAELPTSHNNYLNDLEGHSSSSLPKAVSSESKSLPKADTSEQWRSSRGKRGPWVLDVSGTWGAATSGADITAHFLRVPVQVL